MDMREETWASAVRAERTGDRVAYEKFLREFSTSLRRLVSSNLRRLGLNISEAEDVVQEVLIAVHSRRMQWDLSRPLMPWLNAISRYKIIDASRRIRRDLRLRVELSEDEWSNLFSATFDPTLNTTDVEKLISALPTKQQVVVRAIGLDGASPSETAARLGTSEGAVRVAFHRSLKALISASRK